MGTVHLAMDSSTPHSEDMWTSGVHFQVDCMAPRMSPLLWYWRIQFQVDCIRHLFMCVILLCNSFLVHIPRSYGRLPAKKLAQIGMYAIEWEQLNCHAGTHLPLAHEILPLFRAPHEVLPLFSGLVKVMASDARISQVSRSHVVSLVLKFCKLSALPLSSFAWM